MNSDSGEDRRAYLGFIQGTITRLSGASFQLKGWTVALGSVIIGLTAKDSRADLAWVAMIPAVIFWLLDAFYVQLEYRYRVLFNEAAAGKKETYDMRAGGFGLGDVLSSMWRPSLCPIYVMIIVLALIVVAVAATQGRQHFGVNL